MLVLSRKMGESIQIGTDVTITIRKLSKTRVSVTIEAPEEVRIVRSELVFDAEHQGGLGRMAPIVDEI